MCASGGPSATLAATTPGPRTTRPAAAQNSAEVRWAGVRPPANTSARTTFPHACLIADAGVLRGRRFGNLVLAVSQEPLPADALTRRAAGDPMPGRVLHGRDLDRFTAGAKPVTDATAAPSPAAPPEAFAY